jgi:hypothetical protein
MRSEQSSRGCWSRLLGAGVWLFTTSACAPPARPLVGAITRDALPTSALSPRPQVLRFTWSYADETFEAAGDGAVRVMAPDRARLDFFLRNGMTGGFAILIADTLTVPGGDLVRRLLPPVPLLWASLGRLAVPPTADTVVRLDGDTLRADLGQLRGGDATSAAGRVWRLQFTGRQLVAVERIEGGRVQESVHRHLDAAGRWQVQYLHPRGKRRLTIVVNDTVFVEGFDAAIWRR